MITIDMRFDKEILRHMIGSKFVKYKCDKFVYTNSVTGIVGLYIGDVVYSISNLQESVDYFGNNEDIAVMRLRESNPDSIKSVFNETNQIDTPINGTISKISVINDNQMIKKGGALQYDVWLTRALIFEVDGREILFEKDSVPFSEEIIIRRGYDLANAIADGKAFLEGWPKDLSPDYKREVIVVE